MPMAKLRSRFATFIYCAFGTPFLFTLHYYLLLKKALREECFFLFAEAALNILFNEFCGTFGAKMG